MYKPILITAAVNLAKISESRISQKRQPETNDYRRSVCWWCISFNEFTVTTTAGGHVTVWLWLNDSLALCECWNDVKLQWPT